MGNQSADVKAMKQFATLVENGYVHFHVTKKSISRVIVDAPMVDFAVTETCVGNVIGTKSYAEHQDMVEWAERTS